MLFVLSFLAIRILAPFTVPSFFYRFSWGYIHLHYEAVIYMTICILRDVLAKLNKKKKIKNKEKENVKNKKKRKCKIFTIYGFYIYF